VDIRGRRSTDPILCASTEDPLDGWALVADQAVVAEDEDAVGGILDEGSKALLTTLKVDDEQPLGHRLLEQASVLEGQDARRTAERDRDEDDEEARRDDGNEEDAGPGRGDAILDQPCILVDVVDTDRIAVDDAADRDEEFEVVPRERRHCVDPCRATGGHVSVEVAGDAVPRVRRGDLRSDRETPVTEPDDVRIDDPSVARPDVDPTDLARLGESLELGIDRRQMWCPQIEARLPQLGVDVAADDRLDVVDRRLRRAAP
jgi:hypothetical protein